MDSCEYCGGDLGGNERFCSNKCKNESMKNRVEIVCEVCGKSFEVMESISHRYSTCSDECKSENRSGERNYNWKVKVEVECEYCDVLFKVPPSEESRKFCSRGCLADWRSENKSGEDSWNWKGSQVTLECDQCDGEYTTSKHQSEEYNSRFCSNECKWGWQDENFHLDGHPNWKGGYSFPKGPSWVSKREEALDRDGWECQNCGMDNESHIEEYGFEIEVHHIIPYRKFDSDEEAHELSNLVALCRGCHTSFESLPESEQRQKLAV